MAALVGVAGLRARNWDNGHLARCGMVALVGVAGLRARNWDNGHLARCGRARSSSAPPGGASPLGEPPPYGTSTTTLKNRIAAFSASVAPSTDFHSPFSTIALTGNAAILATILGGSGVSPLLRKLGTNESEVVRVLANRASKIRSERIHALGLNSQRDLDIRPNAGKMRDDFIHNLGNLGSPV